MQVVCSDCGKQFKVTADKPGVFTPAACPTCQGAIKEIKNNGSYYPHAVIKN